MGYVYFSLLREAHGASETHVVPARPGPGPESGLVTTSCGPGHRAQFSVLSLLCGVAAGSRGLTDSVLFSSLFPHPTIALLSLTLIQLPLGVSAGWLSVLLLFLHCLTRWRTSGGYLFVVVPSLGHVRLCHPMDCYMPRFPVPRCLPELAHVLWVRGAI